LKLAVVSPETASENTASRTTFCSLVTAPWLPLTAMYGAYNTPTGLHTHRAIAVQLPNRAFDALYCSRLPAMS